MKSCHLLLSLLVPGLLVLPAAAQTIKIEQSPGPLNWLTHDYRPRTVPGIDLNNSPRLESLIRSSNLYLSAEDAVALAIENNLDIEVQRYAPLLQAEVLRRAQSGGALRSVGQGVAAGPQSVSLTGVSVNSGGATAGTGGNGVSSGGGIVTQLGPSLLSLDPSLSVFANFAHTTSPQSNTFLSGTTSLVTGTRSFNASYSQNWVFGLTAQLTYAANHTQVNSKQFALNPYTSGDVDLQITQNLLQGFGASVNGRNIRVQKNNIKVTDLQFKQQLMTTVSAVLNLYWDLVSFTQDVRARQRELEAAQQLLSDNRRQVDLGTLAELEITRAESQVYTAQQDLVVSQTNLLQQETVLKNALVRDGIARANLSNIRVIPLGQLTVPSTEETPALDQLVQEALGKRTEIETNRINIQSNELNLVGIKSSLKPSLQLFADLTNNALAGVASNPASVFAGGSGLFLSQIFDRNYPNYSAGVSLSIAIHNRAAQSDYVTSQLELRQNELSLHKSVNQVTVDVENAMIGLQQARARYQAAGKARALSQQTLDADQERLRLGVTTPYQVVTDQQNLASAISSESQAVANYSHARIAFDQAMGRTLEVNNISIEDALNGRVSRTSVLPAALPAGVAK